MRNTPSIFDNMVLLQKILSTLETFGALSNNLLNKALRGSCRVAFFVTDKYLKNSIKLMERKRQKTSESVWIVVYRDETNVCQNSSQNTLDVQKTKLTGGFPTQRLVNSNTSAP